MGLPPLSYHYRSLFVRYSSTLLTVVGIAATVAVLAGVLALQQGFERLFKENGRADVAVFMRPGATSEGESAFQRDRATLLIKELGEVALGKDGQPLAGGELYLAVRLRKTDGGETNVPIRGVQPATFAIAGERLRFQEGGRSFTPGNDEVIVGRALVDRIRGCQVGHDLKLNTGVFKVVGIFEYPGPYESEIWGDFERLSPILDRPAFSRVIAQVKPGTDLEKLAARLKDDKRVPATVVSERKYLSDQTGALSFVLLFLGQFLAIVMGTAAVLTGVNTMMSAVAARQHEIGVLLSIGFRPFGVFVGFMLEALLLGLLGGLVGCLMVLPLHGVRTGTTNFQTFTEVAFAFRVTPFVLIVAVLFAVVLGLLGGAYPAWRAARMRPTEALRRV